MASVLKRKRGPVEVVEPSKKPKFLPKSNNPNPFLDSSQVEWDAVFPGKEHDEIAATNGVNGISGSRRSTSLEAEEYESLLTKEQSANSRKISEARTPQIDTSKWKISESIGGRLLDLDPVFTNDEKYLILAHRKTIQVYSTSNSLLIRSINLFVDEGLTHSRYIVDYVISPTNSNIICIGCSDGAIYRIDWTSGEGWNRSWQISETVLTCITAASVDFDGQKRDVIFTTTKQGEGWRITAHDPSPLGVSPVAQSRVIYTSPRPIQIMKAASEGNVIVAASEERILLGTLRSTSLSMIDKMRYEFRIFESPNFVSCMDIRLSKRTAESGRKSTKLDRIGIVDVVVGDVKGAIFVHNDLLGNLIRSQNPQAEGFNAINLVPRKLHWHRKAVQSAKWSLDGNYIISGGSETVLVLWQLDTGRQQHLPHLSAAIRNIVLSPLGTSYAVHLGDNSTMVLSTSELTPIANVAGIQANIIETAVAPDARVLRARNVTNGKPRVPRTTAVINPVHPNWLHLAVGEAQEFNLNSPSVNSAPYLQTFDIASNYNVSRQALSRTNVTNKNITPNSRSLSEPAISHMQISFNGQWLSTVDEWLPPNDDFEFLSCSRMNLETERCRRREVYLKFWQWNKSEKCWVLVSRIDGPHSMATENYCSGRILALTADFSSLTFSTLGEDGVVKIWRPKMRKRDGVIVRGDDSEPLCTWSCQRQIPLGTAGVENYTKNATCQTPLHGTLAFSEDGSVLAAAMSGYDGGFIHIIDPLMGVFRSSHPGMYRGDLISMVFLGQYLVTLADDLRVYDLVIEELKYGIRLGAIKSLLSLEQKAEMMHLAVDKTSSTFAVALPTSIDYMVMENTSTNFTAKAYTEFAVFDPHDPTPLYTRNLASLATAVLPAISSPGFVVLDSAAEVTIVSPKAAQTLISSARPMAELRLDIRSMEMPPLDIIEATPEADEEAEFGMDEDVIEDVTNVPLDPDDDGPDIVTQQQLAQLFDIGPSFALPPVEEMFYRVAGLISRKSVVKSGL